MNRVWRLVLYSFFILIHPINTIAQIVIDIVYPKEGQEVRAVESTFIYGSVTPADAEFSINARDVKLYPNGAFLANLEIEPGLFPYVCVAITEQDTGIVIRNVYVPHPIRSTRKDTLLIEPEFVIPQSETALLPGEAITVAFKGTPKCKAAFRISGLSDFTEMQEISTKSAVQFIKTMLNSNILSDDEKIRGVYSATYKINDDQQPVDSRYIFFRLIKSKQDTVYFTAPGKLSVLSQDSLQTVRIMEESILPLRNPRPGHQLFLPENTFVNISGIRGNLYQIHLSPDHKYWIRQERFEQMYQNYMISPAILNFVETKGFVQKSRIRISLNRQVPFKIVQVNSPAFLYVTLFGVNPAIEAIKQDYTDPIIDDIQWELISENVYKMKIVLNLSQQWGYDPVYEDNDLIIDIKKPPYNAAFPGLPLTDISICIDPGHNPDDGAIGPTRLVEKDINYEYSVLLKNKLEQKGAFVFLTRGKEDGISVYTRPKLAAFIGADILLSMHFNSVPDGADPLKARGASTYYYHPQSYKLAYLVQQKLLQKTDSDNFGLRFGNFTVIRATQMLSVLVEPAFIIHPEDEIKIRSTEFQDQVTDAIVEAIEEFLQTHL